MAKSAVINMDAYLAQLGLCRKTIVRDGSCLFRAVSEKLFLTQVYHLHIRQMCAEYLGRHMLEFGPPEWEGQVEMMVLSHLYSVDFIIFQNPGYPPVSVTMNKYQNKVYLCFVDGIHYDCVYPRSLIQHSAICQSVIYEVLYRGVFGLSSELEEAVTFIRQQKKGTRENSFSESHENGFLYADPQLERPLFRSTPPLPYRIAKALDPDFFRNVELDIIQEEKREAKLRKQLKESSAEFAPGDKCQLCLSTQPSKVYNGHIQELTDNQGPVVVFIEELGEKRAVPYDSLRPLPLAPVNDCTSSVGNKSKRKKGLPLATEYNHQQYHITGRGLHWNIRRNFDMGRKVNPAESSLVKKGDPVDHDSHYNQVTPPIPMSTSQSPLVTSPALTATPVYWMLAVNVPFLNTIGQVNLNWMPSQDPLGKDLPIADINTLRYFFNLGVEYYRVSSNLQQPMAPPLGTALPPPPPAPAPPMMMTPTLTLQPQIDQGQCHHQPNTNYSNKYSPQKPRQASSKSDQGTNTVSGGSSGSSALLDIDRDQDVDSFSLSQESGCLSDCSESLSPTKSEGRSEDGDCVTDPVNTGGKQNDKSSTNSEFLVEGVQEQSKNTKGKKKYYMYGSHKLVKPIKEIPPRFQSLLAEMNAAKIRCEGQLIYIQDSFEHDSNTCLNVDANCFVPGTEMGNGFPSDRCGSGTVGNGQVSFIPCIMPPPNPGPVNPSALPQMTYVGLPTAPPPPLHPAINKPPPTPMNNGSCGYCVSCQQPVNTASTRTSSSNASASTALNSGSSKDSALSVPTPVPSSQSGTPQNPVAPLQFVPPTSMAFIPPPPIPANSGMPSNSSTNMANFPPNMSSIPPTPAVLPPPPPVLPPLPPPPVPPRTGDASNPSTQPPAVQVSSHPLPGGGSYYIYHTSSSSTGFTASHSLSAQTPVYYVVNPSCAAAPCGYQPAAIPAGYGINTHCQAAVQ